MPDMWESRWRAPASDIEAVMQSLRSSTNVDDRLTRTERDGLELDSRAKLHRLIDNTKPKQMIHRGPPPGFILLAVPYSPSQEDGRSVVDLGEPYAVGAIPGNTDLGALSAILVPRNHSSIRSESDDEDEEEVKNLQNQVDVWRSSYVPLGNERSGPRTSSGASHLVPKLPKGLVDYNTSGRRQLPMLDSNYQFNVSDITPYGQLQERPSASTYGIPSFNLGELKKESHHGQSENYHGRDRRASPLGYISEGKNDSRSKHKGKQSQFGFINLNIHSPNGN
jgi:hypothetical protein